MRPDSIQSKLSALIFALTVVIVAVFTIFLPRVQRAAALQELVDKTRSYGDLVAREVEPAVAFDDRETARETFDALAQDHAVRGIVLFGAGGRQLHVFGEPTSLVPPRVTNAASLETTAAMIRYTAPVVSREGPRGLLVLELSTERLELECARIRRLSLLIGVADLLFGFAGAWLIGRSLARRIRVLAEATKAVAKGELDVVVTVDPSADEAGQLSRSFAAMLRNIQELVAHIAESAATEKQRLDLLVEQRTSELAARNRQMRLVLDNVGQGFLTLDRHGVVGAERSNIVDRWFGEPAAGVSFGAYIAPSDPTAAEWFAIGWEALLDDVLPLEVVLDQLPKTLQSNQRCYRLEYQPIFARGEVDSVLIIISDVTSEVERARIEEMQRDRLHTFQRLVEDRQGFSDFFEESSALVTKIVGFVDGDLVDLKRAIHTLKGNSGLFGLGSVSRACNDIETTMAETEEAPSRSETLDLVQRWQPIAEMVAMVTEPLRDRAEVDRAELSSLAAAITQGEGRSRLAARVRALTLEPVERRLRRLGDHARDVAARLGKPDVQIIQRCDATRVDGQIWGPFWGALVHVVRNAADHGIESPEEREALGKSSRGSITLGAEMTTGGFVIEVRDDGRGIGWDSVAARAAEVGCSAANPRELQDALFHDGLSTRREVSEVSGRGIGLGAVRAACEALGGSVHIHSDGASTGTSVKFQFPPAALAPASVSITSIAS